MKCPNLCFLQFSLSPSLEVPRGGVSAFKSSGRFPFSGENSAAVRDGDLLSQFAGLASHGDGGAEGCGSAARNPGWGKKKV
jgi:hypothetical protein